MVNCIKHQTENLAIMYKKYLYKSFQRQVKDINIRLHNCWGLCGDLDHYLSHSPNASRLIQHTHGRACNEIKSLTYCSPFYRTTPKSPLDPVANCCDSMPINIEKPLTKCLWYMRLSWPLHKRIPPPNTHIMCAYHIAIKL
jgi:hypothetical protein